MQSCDVLIVGGGPAGSSCAWRLRDSGLNVAILDKETFPRDKVCGGWITPQVLTALQIDSVEYGSTRVLQPITSFKTGCIGNGPPTHTDYRTPVSYGIRRREFDHYLLRRSAARLHEGVGLASLERTAGGWTVNGNLRARWLVGAGGHFCPVARLLSAKGPATAVAAQEVEFEMDTRQAAECPIQATTPELYFCPDMKGYGWCFRKGNILNVGLGRADSRGLPEHVNGFLQFLSLDVPAMKGHAYFLFGTSQRKIAGDGFLLVGDSAGLAYPQSGEGILPAIESGLLAAETILGERESYTDEIAGRFGTHNWVTGIGRRIPTGLVQFAAARLMATDWFVRGFVLDRWFLHRQ